MRQVMAAQKTVQTHVRMCPDAPGAAAADLKRDRDDLARAVVPAITALVDEPPSHGVLDHEAPVTMRGEGLIVEAHNRFRGGFSSRVCRCRSATAIRSLTGPGPPSRADISGPE